MAEKEQPKSAWDKFFNTELADKLDEFGVEQPIDQPKTKTEPSQTTIEPSPSGMVAIEFYLNNVTWELISLTYYKGYSTQIQQYRPDHVTNGGAGYFNIQNVTELEGLVLEYEGQLEFRGIRFHRLESKKIGENDKGTLFMHDYGVTKGLNKELSGVLEHVQRKYRQL